MSHPRESGNVIRIDERIRVEDSTSISRAPLRREVIGVFWTLLGQVVASALVNLVVGSGAVAPAVPRPDPSALRTRIDELLRVELTRDWYPRAVDRERGGFHQTFARDWSPRPDDDTFLVYQARMTWTAAAFARYSPAHRDEFAGYARHGIAFLDSVMRDKELGGFHWMLDPQGRVSAGLGDEKHAYGISFVIYAASTVRDVTGDERALQVARDAFDWLDQHAHDAKHGGYFEAMRRDGTPIVGWDEDTPIARRTDRVGIYYGFKTMNVHIHLLEALTALSRVDRRPVVMDRLRELHGVVRDRIAVEPGALNLYLTPDWRAIPAHDSFGHDVETAYLLVEAAEALGMPDDAKTWRGRPEPGRSCPRLGLGRRARRLLRQGRVVRQPGVGHEESLVDRGRGPATPCS